MLNDTAYNPSIAAKTLPGYDAYMANGSAAQSDIELSRMDTMQVPLLDRRSVGFHQKSLISAQSLTPLLSGPIQRSYSPSPAYVSTDNLMNQAPSAATTPSSYYPPNQRSSVNLLAGQQSSDSMNQYPPQQYSRQSSGNMLHSPQRAGSPGPYQAYAPPQQQMAPQHSRQTSGNMLAQGGRQSPGPYQAYGHQPPGLNQSQSSFHHQQPSNSSNGHSANMAGRGAHRAW